jgi:hypothetical protein
MFKLRWIRKPKIWMLTGRYLLKDARSMVIYNHNPVGKIGICSATVAALTGVPIGGSVQLDHNSGIKARMEMPGENVWAARYHLLDTTFVKMKTGDKPSLPVSIALHPDITSKGTLRKTDDNEVAQVSIMKAPNSPRKDLPLEQIDNSKELDDQLLDEYEETEQYEHDLEDAIRSFEEILEKASQAATSAKSSGSDSEDDGGDDEED